MPFRLPQDLTDFMAAGTITQEILDDPNILLKKRADAQNITATTVIVITTNPADPLFGGGTANIAFLLGDKNATTPNADAIQMSATFWIETVTEQITVPAYTADQPVIVQGTTSAGNPVVSFSVTSDADRPGHHDRCLLHPDPVHPDSSAELQPPDLAACLGRDARAQRTRPGGDLTVCRPRSRASGSDAGTRARPVPGTMAFAPTTEAT